MIFRIFIFLCIPLSAFAIDGFRSSPFVPIHNPVYSYLEKCASYGNIHIINLGTAPLTRDEIILILESIHADRDFIEDDILHDELDYYLRVFGCDLEGSEPRSSVLFYSMIGNPLEWVNPYHHFLKNGDKNQIAFDPVIGGRWDIGDDVSLMRRYTGLQLYGSFDSKVGYYFRFQDNVERGNGPYWSRDDLLHDRFGYVGPLTGGQETYYDMTEAYITLSWKWFDFVLGKDRVAWGPGEEKLLLSGNSPSFNHFRSSVRISNGSGSQHLRFHYLIGSLTSYNIPGDTLYQTPEGWTRILPDEKWIVAHRLEYSPFDDLLVSVGEALIWGDRGIELAYLNPINFLYSAEHDGGDLDNVLLHGDFRYRIDHFGQIYGSMLIDDLSISTLGQGNPGNKLGYTCGLSVHNLALDGLSTNLEYVRLNPYLYSHFYPVNRFTNWTSSLGSTLKPNSDQLKWTSQYKLFRWLSLELSVGWNRHGTLGGEIEETIPRNSDFKAHFLAGDRNNWTETEISVDWEILPELVFTAGIVSGAKDTFLPDRYFTGISYREN